MSEREPDVDPDPDVIEALQMSGGVWHYEQAVAITALVRRRELDARARAERAEAQLLSSKLEACKVHATFTAGCIWCVVRLIQVLKRERNEARGRIVVLEAREKALLDLAELAWGLIANAGRDWTLETNDWQEAAARWRESYFGLLSAPPPEEPKP